MKLTLRSDSRGMIWAGLARSPRPDQELTTLQHRYAADNSEAQLSSEVAERLGEFEVKRSEPSGR